MRLNDDSVKWVNMHPQASWASMEVDKIYRKHMDLELVVTSANDSHESGLHPEGKAFDCRTWIAGEQWDSGIRYFIVDKIRLALGSDFDVIGETDHIHVEYDSHA